MTDADAWAVLDGHLPRLIGLADAIMACIPSDLADGGPRAWSFDEPFANHAELAEFDAIAAEDPAAALAACAQVAPAKSASLTAAIFALQGFASLRAGDDAEAKNAALNTYQEKAGRLRSLLPAAREDA